MQEVAVRGFGASDVGCNAQIGVMHNGASGGIAGNARLMSIKRFIR